jgi:hypothetical protein
MILLLLLLFMILFLLVIILLMLLLLTFLTSFDVTSPVAIFRATTPVGHHFIDAPVANILNKFRCHYSLQFLLLIF